MWKRFGASLLTALLLASCSDSVAPEEERPFGDELRLRSFELVNLGADVPWYRSTTRATFEGYPQDEEGVLLFLGPDGEYHYHPVEMAQKGLAMVALYRRTGDERALDYARRHADRMLAEADTIGDGLYFPYTFDWRLHLNANYELMRAPWYSGMAQGQALSLLVHLHRITGEPAYLAAAHDVFRTFLRPGSAGETVRVDTAGYYWIEEYPADQSTGTLNGFIFGIYGLYDYYQWTGDEDAFHVLVAGLTTIHDKIHLFRAPSGPSYYCLSHRAQYPVYHQIHIVQLLNLFEITGEPYFEEMAAQFDQDA